MALLWHGQGPCSPPISPTNKIQRLKTKALMTTAKSEQNFWNRNKIFQIGTL